MSTLFGVRNLLFAAPVLAALAVFAAVAPASEVDVASDAAVVASDAVVADVVVVDDVTVIDDIALALASNCSYYSNASLTTIVGQFGYDCCNNPVSWGRKTKFKVCGGCFPCIPPPQ